MMIHFIYRSLKWLLYLGLTTAFFLLPTILERYVPTNDLSPRLESVDSSQVGFGGPLSFEFDRAIFAESLSQGPVCLRLRTITDSAPKVVHLYVNGRRHNTAQVSDSTTAVFPGIHLRKGLNEVTAILSMTTGRSLAVRRLLINSANSM